MWYIVQPWDSLYMIALRFGVSISQLFQFNPMAYYTLYVGQRLFIPVFYSRALVNYTVTTGDTLDSIAQNFNTTKQSIMQLNNLSSEVMVPGQKLNIDTGSRTSLPDSRPIKSCIYVVEAGDTLNSIAQKFNTTKQSLMILNNLSSDFIVPGLELQIETRSDTYTKFRATTTYTAATGDTLDSIAQKLNIDTGSRTSLLSSRPINNYIVEVGDTLDSIAQKFNVTKQSIMLLNNLSSDFIVPDQVLKIETRSDRPYTKFRPTATYTVQIGDTLESIARKFNTTKEALMKLNGLVSDILKAGNTLNIDFPRERFPETTGNPQEDININSKYKIFSIYDSGLKTDIKIWKELSTQDTFFFVSKMVVTAAGAPQAFHKEDQLAYDFLDNAGTIGYWWSLVTDDQGFPLVQGINDPAPGYFVSKTALSDCSKPLKDPTRYVDASTIPYIALPAMHMMGAKLGDLCVVINTLNNKIGYAIIADVGLNNSIGIGSIALAKDIGIAPSPKIGGVEDGILYIVFSQSGEGWCKFKTREQVINEANWLFKRWGGIEKVRALFDKFPLSSTSI